MPLLATLSSWLISIAGNVATRVLAALGFGILTYAGISTIFDQIVEMAQNHYNSIPAATLQLAALAGIPDGLAILVSGFTTRLSLFSMKKLALK